MVYLSEAEIYTSYKASSEEADLWRIDYPQYERLADNGLLDDLDENLPEVNDGSLAASLFKLAKRVIKKKLGGQAIALNRDEAWITKLANIYWQKKILPNARSKAKPRAKWKDAVRKAAIYGGQPIITLFLTRGNYTGSDFIVPYAQDVKLEAGKDSDEDSDVIFWDVYYSRLQLENMIEQAKAEMAEGTGAKRESEDDTADAHSDTSTKSSAAVADSKTTDTHATGSTYAAGDHDAENDAEDSKDNADEPYNYWDVDALQAILDSKEQEVRPGNQTSKSEVDGKGKKKTGYHFFIAFQRGVEAPFMMCHNSTKKCVREWKNPDPTGDIPVHYLYCYQDFINPYGIGIVKLAGGTQNVLDYMRQADILATQLGLRPPKQIQGDEDQVDEDSLVYAQDANWYVGNAKVERMEIANEVYTQLPGRINMYQTSLQKMIPTGDTSISASTSGDSTQSKTPAGVKLAAANLSIDDEDFSENVDETYAAVARSMINVQFANMQGTDIFKLSDDERDELVKAGLQFPVDAQGKPIGNDLNIIWDHSRAEFDFEIDPSTDSQTTPEDQIAIIQETLKTVTPQTNYYLAQDGWKFNMGEAYYGLLKIIGLENFNDIITKMTDEEKAEAKKMPFPIIDPPQIRLTGQIPTQAMSSALAQGGVNVPEGTPMGDDQVDVGDILHYGAPSSNERAQILELAGIKADPVDPNAAPATAETPPPQDPNVLTANEKANIALKADAQQHQQAMDKTKLALELEKTQAAAQTPPPAGAKTPVAPAATTAPVQVAPTEPAAAAPTEPTPPVVDPNHPDNQAKIAAGHIAEVMKSYSVDAPTAAAMLEAERLGYSVQEVLDALKRNSGKLDSVDEITQAEGAPAHAAK